MLDREIIIRRLAIIKYLHNIGVQQSMQVETVAGFSVLAFHDCAEMFLLLVAEHKGDNCEKWSFMEFWNKYPELSLKESMRNLKDRRVSVKHKGQFLSKTDIEISRVTITDFLEQNTPIQFGIEYNDISVSELISYNNVKEYVNKAEVFYNENKLYECLSNCKIAFLELLYTYEASKINRFGIESSISVGEEIGNDYQLLVGNDDKQGARWFKEVTDTTNKIRDLLKIVALGIDFKRYTYFETITPEVRVWWEEGAKEYEPYPQEYYNQYNLIRGEDCRFCINFVIDSALKLQEFDYDINNIIK